MLSYSRNIYNHKGIREKRVQFVLAHTVHILRLYRTFSGTLAFKKTKEKSDEDPTCNGSDYEPRVGFYMTDPCDVFKSDKSKPAQVCYCQI